MAERTVFFHDPVSGRPRARRVDGTLRFGRRLRPPHIHLDHPSIAAEHAELSVDGERTTVRPLCAEAAVFVNGELVRRSRQLTPGDAVQLGTLELVFGAREPGAHARPHARVALPTAPAPAARRTGPTSLVLPAVLAVVAVVAALLITVELLRPEPAVEAPPSTGRAAVANVMPSVVTLMTRAYGHDVVLGTGVVVSARGRILTNAHVVSDLEVVTVRTHSGEQYRASVTAADVWRDLALLKLPDVSSTFVPARIGSEVELEAGQNVYVIGSPLATELSLSVTRGVISAPKRYLAGRRFIQHDAALNPGNSGGPLLDETGLVIGINTMKITEVGGTAMQGLGFAIPGPDVRKFLERQVDSD
jgi:S1-C subfamily serine protease